MRKALRRIAPRTIRLKLVLAISAVSVIAMAASFYAIHRVTDSELRGNIDDELRSQETEFEQQVPAAAWSDSAALERASRSFVNGQRYHPESRIFVIDVAGRPVVTNETGVLNSERAEEAAEGESEDDDGSDDGEPGEHGGESDHAQSRSATLLSAPAGLSTVSSEEAGELRVLTKPLIVDGNKVGTFRAADPLTSIDSTLEQLRNTFLAVGVWAVALSVLIAIWLAALISGPLRRMARVAEGVDSGDLSHRIDYTGRDEVGALAHAFNGMLDRLEAAFRREREFVSDASHELRSPLTVLRGRIEMLIREGGGPDRTAEEARALLREVSRMDRLVDDLLTLAKAESGTLVHPRPVPVEDFAEDLRRDLPLLGARDYRVESNANGTIDADPDRLAQVLRNLVSNAVRHTGEDGRITVSIDSRNGSTTFAVQDDGPGIPPSQIDRVFDRFYRTDEGRTRDGGGSGLGLAIAKAIVEAHGGRITAESPRGGGTTFRFDLPTGRA